MAPATVNEANNYDLRSAGADGVFDWADDVPYTVSSYGYSSGLSASYRILNGPLQAGLYRFRAATGLTDRAGNPLASTFVRTFTVADQAPFVVESRDNDSRV